MGHDNGVHLLDKGEADFSKLQSNATANEGYNEI